MEVVIFLIAVASSVGALFLALFFWGLREGQFEELDLPARRMLEDDEE